LLTTCTLVGLIGLTYGRIVSARGCLIGIMEEVMVTCIWLTTGCLVSLMGLIELIRAGLLVEIIGVLMK